jgi:hypothetical protein
MKLGWGQDLNLRPSGYEAKGWNEGNEPGAPGTRRPPTELRFEKSAEISLAACWLVPPSVTTFNGAQSNHTSGFVARGQPSRWDR